MTLVGGSADYFGDSLVKRRLREIDEAADEEDERKEKKELES